TMNGFPIRVYMKGKQSLPVVGLDGKRRQVETRVHDVKVHDLFSVDEPSFEMQLAKGKALKKLKIGESYSCLMPAGRATEILKEIAGKRMLWYMGA
ncbi:MAG: hypothetical protein JW744_03240, partial [Candidatus Diapherotrites archaeon]|nr:hypothetical protein [Candidatus Diapherotrites archaeon]